MSQNFPLRARARTPLAALGLWLPLALGLVSCGGGGDPFVPQGPVDTPAATVLAIQADLGCLDDAECGAGFGCFQRACVQECRDATGCATGESCSPHGRCETPGGAVARADATTRLSVVQAPTTSFDVAPGQANVTLHLDLSGALPAGGMVYRVARTDDPAAGAALSRVLGGSSVDIPIPVGRADPNHALGALGVFATVYTAVGRFDLELRPAPPVSGRYAGDLALTGVGAFPVEFAVVTNPPGATLASAIDAYLVLDVDPVSFLSPETPGARVRLASRLSFNAFANAYVATFQHASDVQPPYGQVFSLASGTVGRAMRFEVQPQPNGTLSGRFVDAWSGLFDVSGVGGVLEPGDTYRVGTFSLSRTGSGPTAAEVASLPVGSTAPVATVSPMPPLTACVATAPTGTSLASIPACNLGATPADNLTWFANLATPAERAACAMAMATTATTGSTVVSALTGYLSGATTMSGSFATFLDDCAAGTGGTCVPTPATLCARQLAAYAYRGLAGDPALASQVFGSYVAATREATLGPQLAAFWADYNARIDWLTVGDAAPMVIASALRDDAVSRMDAWKVAVLDRHLASLALQLDASARSMFARAPSTPQADGERVSALVLASQSWRGAADALTYGARRWNLYLYGTTAAEVDVRSQKVAIARGIARDLYLAASVIDVVAGPTGGAATSSFAGALDGVQRSLLELAMPFERLVFARDAEVVVSTSLDPLMSTATVLSDRETRARAALQAATVAVDGVVASVVADSLSATTLVGGLTTELLSTQNEIASLCGLPVGCTADRIGIDANCGAPVADGRCGFSVNQGTGAIDFQASGNLSRAAAEILEVRRAYRSLAIAAADRDAHAREVAYSYANLEAFADDVQQWNLTRGSALDQMADIFEQQNSLADGALATLIRIRAQQARIRQDSIDGDAVDLALWDRIRRDATSAQFTALVEANNLATVSAALNLTADGIDFVAETTAGAENPIQLAVGLGIGAAAFGLRGAAIGVDHLAAQRELDADRVTAYADLQLEQLMAQADLSSAQTDADLQELETAIETARGLSAAQSDALGRALEFAREQRAAELAFARDLAELRDRRFEHFKLVQQTPQFSLEVDQAALAVQQRILEYHLTAQKAQLAEGRRALLAAQLGDTQGLLGGPAAVFARVNHLDRAELHLATAKDAMMDWLTALEYLAVRPFVDHRRRILLARNTSQLLDIATSLDAVSASCGGVPSTATVTFSLRDDMLELSRSIEDVDGTVISPVERFRRALERGAVPIDRRVRYSSDQTVGQLLDSESGVLALSFDLSLEDFGNLALACNAKMVRFEVQLVGQIGSGLPAVTLLYDGTSQMRSCQPDLDTYVASQGSDSTNFGQVTLFRTAGRSASPVASINTFTPGNANAALDGLPLASTYTLLIDKSVGDNAQIDWSRLEDVQFRVEYVYQNAFPAGQCEE